MIYHEYKKSASTHFGNAKIIILPTLLRLNNIISYFFKKNEY